MKESAYLFSIFFLVFSYLELEIIRLNYIILTWIIDWRKKRKDNIEVKFLYKVWSLIYEILFVVVWNLFCFLFLSFALSLNIIFVREIFFKNRNENEKKLCKIIYYIHINIQINWKRRRKRRKNIVFHHHHHHHHQFCWSSSS